MSVEFDDTILPVNGLTSGEETISVISNDVPMLEFAASLSPTTKGVSFTAIASTSATPLPASLELKITQLLGVT